MQSVVLAYLSRKTKCHRNRIIYKCEKCRIMVIENTYRVSGCFWRNGETNWMNNFSSSKFRDISHPSSETWSENRLPLRNSTLRNVTSTRIPRWIGGGQFHFHAQRMDDHLIKANFRQRKGTWKLLLLGLVSEILEKSPRSVIDCALLFP